jgi:hypothetical protein
MPGVSEVEGGREREGKAHLGCLGHVFAVLSAFTCLGAVLYCRGHADLDAMQCGRVVHLRVARQQGINVAQPRPLSVLPPHPTHPIPLHKRLNTPNLVPHNLHHALILREQTRACWRIVL